ncbi:hypothetical protein H8N00_00820 [Streptomyces sp. AC563]|uniref:hypothetical protein n=1 Tax=Streptomyces buecherae TaxID=2763006 RepID=UPI00164D52EC|nr:hypothetical protein [Streptomyces buecherae]MBC3987477.1 hypothetical protein [Streptomyces buecherae]
MGDSMDALLPATCDAITYARAYTERLGWPVAPGHRYRPRRGCTCGVPECPTPGAHPPARWTVATRADELPEEEFGQPGVGVIAPALGFGAVTLPRAIGMMAMVSIDRRMRAPCLVGPDSVTLLVQPGTASVLGSVSAATVLTGAGEWLALPPSHGMRWDTPPWDERTGHPLALPHGHSLVRDVREAVRIGSGE